MDSLKNMVFSKSFVASMLAIAATGALLKIAADGKLGTQAQSAAKFITAGYGDA